MNEGRSVGYHLEALLLAIAGRWLGICGISGKAPFRCMPPLVREWVRPVLVIQVEPPGTLPLEVLRVVSAEVPKGLILLLFHSDSFF